MSDTEAPTTGFGAIGTSQPASGFGVPGISQPASGFGGMHHPFPTGSPHASAGRAESVQGDVPSGGSNTGGVVRPRRRGIAGTKTSGVGGLTARNYHVATGVKFNNLSELYQDSISPDFAQEIIEDVLGKWHVPFDQPEALKFCEDLIFGFIVAVSASDKANYNQVFDIPVKPVSVGGEVVTTLDGDFGLLSSALIREFGITRRQFARGVADRIRKYLMEPDNVHLLDDVATKVGCDRAMATLAFDGSTHCKGLTVKEVQFTKTLENRNLFERDDEVARGASERLLGSMGVGPRAVR